MRGSATHASLEQRLLDLAACLDTPPEPDLVPAVLARLPERHGPSAAAGPFSARTFVRDHARVRALALALAAGLVLAGTAMAVPPVRNAILRVLGLKGVRIVRVHRLAPVPPKAPPLPLGIRISPARARTAADFRALEPPQATAVYLASDIPGGRISIVAGSLLVVEFRGRGIPFIYKLIAGGTVVRQLRVNGGPGVYISGSPHELMLTDRNGMIRPDTVRLEGSVLVWQQGAVTVRIEGARTLAQALTLARSLR